MSELEHSREGLSTRAIMFEDFQNFTIYVEDQYKEYEYETIFKRMLHQNELKAQFQVLA